MEDELPADVYGLSTWADRRLPLMVLDTREGKTTVERLRFTAAHELAHLLLSFPEESKYSVEKRCDFFASFLLIPKQMFIEELGAEKREKITLEEMIELRSCMVSLLPLPSSKPEITASSPQSTNEHGKPNI